MERFDSFVRFRATHLIKMTVFDPPFCSDDHRKLIVLMATIGNVLTEKSSFDIKNLNLSQLLLLLRFIWALIAHFVKRFYFNNFMDLNCLKCPHPVIN